MARRSVLLDGNKIEAHRLAAGFPRQEDLARAVGLDPSRISRLESGAWESMSETNARRLAAELKVPLDELRKTPAGAEAIDPIRVQLLRDPASIGSVRTHAGGDEVPYSPKPADRGHVFVAVEVRGDCLEPSGIVSGHRAIVDLTIRPHAGNIVLARNEDELLVKRLRSDGNLRYLEADQHWEPLLVADGVEILGVCVSFQYPPPK
jgi:transcriptional regulator with XRE-family HTH domain